MSSNTYTSAHDDFIGVYPNATPKNVTVRLMELFEEANERGLTHKGLTGTAVDSSRKDSLDLSSTRITNELMSGFSGAIEAYFQSLIICHEQYVSRFPILKFPKTYMHGVYEFNIQRYSPPGQAYHAWHHEAPNPNVSDRVLAWMTYLNTVRYGGETEFKYLNRKIKPELGTTLIWPAGFTHTHRGLPAKHEEKLIITGWFRFAPPNTHQL